MQLRLQQQLIYNTHILTAKHKILTNVYKYLQMIIQFIILLQKYLIVVLEIWDIQILVPKKKATP